MTSQPGRRIALASGYFNPLHVGHLRMMTQARASADRLVVIVNNDAQQQGKVGTIIQTVEHRLEIVAALRVVDEVVAAVDEDGTVNATLALLRDRYGDDELAFVQGGDRSDPAAVAELETCRRLGIELVLGVGGRDKVDASSRINRLLGTLP
jgi:cytidyltransferase-like protein